jgi:hypothetical protein
LEKLDKLIVEENYLPKQIFSMDETYPGNGCLKGLSSIRRPRKCHDVQDNFSLGQWKHFVIWHSVNAKAFKYTNKHTLTMYYNSKKS